MLPARLGIEWCEFRIWIFSKLPARTVLICICSFHMRRQFTMSTACRTEINWNISVINLTGQGQAHIHFNKQCKQIKSSETEQIRKHEHISDPVDLPLRRCWHATCDSVRTTYDDIVANIVIINNNETKLSAFLDSNSCFFSALLPTFVVYLHLSSHVFRLQAAPTKTTLFERSWRQRHIENS